MEVDVDTDSLGVSVSSSSFARSRHNCCNCAVVSDVWPDSSSNSSTICPPLDSPMTRRLIRVAASSFRFSLRIRSFSKSRRRAGSSVTRVSTMVAKSTVGPKPRKKVARSSNQDAISARDLDLPGVGERAPRISL